MAQPDRLQILEWKKQYGRVFLGGEGAHTYCFRPLRIREYYSLVKDTKDISLEEQMDIEDMIVSTCLLYPSVDEYGSWPAGLAAQLVDTIMQSSGWGEEELLLSTFEEYQESLSTYLATFRLLIMAAGMGYSWDELEDKSVDDLLELAAAANEILAIKATVATGQFTPLQVTEGKPTTEEEMVQKLHQAARQAGIP